MSAVSDPSSPSEHRSASPSLHDDIAGDKILRDDMPGDAAKPPTDAVQAREVDPEPLLTETHASASTDSLDSADAAVSGPQPSARDYLAAVAIMLAIVGYVAFAQRARVWAPRRPPPGADRAAAYSWCEGVGHRRSARPLEGDAGAAA